MSPLIFFIRHALADYRPGRLYGWTPGVHLSAEGRDQAKRLAERLEAVRFDAIYASPLERCVETAGFVASGRPGDVQIVEELGEVRYGGWQGKSFASLAKTALWRVVQQTPSQATFPGGESLRAMQARSVEAVEAIRGRHRRGILAVVTHADVIKAILAHYLGMHLDLFQRLVIAPASVSVVAFGGGYPRVLRLSDLGDFDEFRPRPRKRS